MTTPEFEIVLPTIDLPDIDISDITIPVADINLPPIIFGPTIDFIPGSNPLAQSAPNGMPWFYTPDLIKIKKNRTVYDEWEISDEQ